MHYALLFGKKKKPFLAYGRGAAATLSGHSVGPRKSSKQGASSKYSQYTLRHGGNWCESDFGRLCISSKPVRGDSASGHSLDTWCEVGRHLPSQYPKGTVRETLKGDAIQKARDGDHCKWHTERKIKHWKKMLRRGRFMLQKGLRNEEHRGGTVLNKLILLNTAGPLARLNLPTRRPNFVGFLNVTKR